MVGCPWLQAFSQNWALFCWGCPDLDTRQTFSPRAAANPTMLGIGQGEQIPRINGKMKSSQLSQMADSWSGDPVTVFKGTKSPH